MGWWDNLISDTKRNFQVGTQQLDKDMAKIDDDLANQKGPIARLLQAIVKIGRLFSRLMVAGIGDLFPGLALASETVFTGRALEIPKTAWDNTIELMAKNLGLNQSEIGILKSFYQSIGDTSPIVQGVSMISIFTTIMQFMMGPGMGKISQSLNKRFSPGVPNSGEVMQARGLDASLDAKIWDVLERNGYTKADIELMFAATYQRIDPASLIEIYHRKGMSDDWLEHRLSELGFTPERISELKTIIPRIPPMQDIVMMLGREAFEPEMISKFGLGAEYPPELTKWAQANGLSEDWAFKYWVAHWKDIGLQTMLEALHRGIQTWDEVYEFMKLVEIPPYFREVIKQISFNPLTRVDVRRIHNMGIIDDERLIKAYEDLGYDRENAEIMSEFTKEYNERAKRDLTKTDILKGYEDRDLDFNTAVFLLVRIGYKEDAANYLVSNVDLVMDRAVRLESIETTKLKYISFLITEADARTELTQSGLNQKRINELLSRWKVQRISNTKHPSKTDLDKLFRAAIITDGEYTAQMAYIGYSEKYILWYKELIQSGQEG